MRYLSVGRYLFRQMNLCSILICAIAGITLLAATTDARQWKPANPRLMTRWGEGLNPAKVHAEYPRPMMVRKRWLNLNGLWDHAVTPIDALAPKEWTGKILVPFPIESALSGVGRLLGASEALWYRRTFRLPRGFAGTNLYLHFDAVDHQFDVWVDGKKFHEITDDGPIGGWGRRSVLLHLEGNRAEHEIIVRVTDSTSPNQARGKQHPKPEGIWYRASSGIWQTVWVEPVPTIHIRSLRITPYVASGMVTIAVDAPGAESFEAIASLGGQEVARSSSKGEITIDIPDARLWSPESPTLYHLTIRALSNGKVADTVESYVGFRSISLGKRNDGTPCILLNGKEIFQVGPLDQGFWPDGLLSAPSEAAMKWDVDQTKKLGFNVIRKHVKVEPERWYAHCDKIGMLVWQDMPSAFFEANLSGGARSAAHGQFERELRHMVRQLYNHPSIVMWVPFNEGWGQYDTDRITQMVRKLDASRLINNPSGWTDVGSGDVHDIHNYPSPAMPSIEPRRAAVLGEFGGLGLGVDGHTWEAKTWGYQGMGDAKALTDKYVGFMRRVYELRDKGLVAAIYTQTTDVESECNGFFTYDRKVLKMDAKRVRSANLGQFPPIPPVVWVAQNAEVGPQDWRYTFERPPTAWFKVDFDDSSWKVGSGGFGTSITPGAIVGTEWSGPEIWIRRRFDCDPKARKNIRLRMHHDEDAAVYINGVLAAKVERYTTGYEDFPISGEAIASLKPTGNTLAVHCRQTSGGQFIDVGLAADGKL